MIRIETTAEFDAQGRFTVRGQAPQGVSPGQHRVTIELEEPVAIVSSPTEVIEDTDDPMLKRINGVLVWTGHLLEDPDEVRRRLDDEQTDRLLSGQCE